MNDNTPIDPDYIRGFNEGYTIARHMPDLAEKLSTANKDSVRGTGFQDGRKQFLTEQSRSRLPAWLKGNRPTKDKAVPDKTVDRDIDPDR